MKPFFSIIVPTYNRREKIGRTINHILSQTFREFEVLVIDDGSTDGTRESVRSIKDKRVIYHYKENEERAVARNYGISKAQGDYITFVDSDDLIYLNYLNAAYELIQKNTVPAWLHVNYEIKAEFGAILKKARIRKGDLGQQLVTGNHLSCLGVFVRRDVLLQESFDEDRRLIGSEDYDLWLRIAARHHLLYTNEVTAAIIQHDERSVVNFSREVLISRISYIIQKHEALQTFSNKEFTNFCAHRYLYLALHLAIVSFRNDSIIYLKKALQLRPELFLSAKVWATIRILFLQ